MRRTYVIQGWSSTRRAWCIYVSFRRQDNFSRQLYVNSRIFRPVCTLKYLLLTGEKYILLDMIILTCGSKRESYILYPFLVRQILRSARSRICKPRDVFFFNPYCKHYLENCRWMLLRKFQEAYPSKIVTLIIILDYVVLETIVQYLRLCGNTSDQANEHVTIQSIV